MPTIEIDKDGGYIVVTEGEVETRTSIKYADTVVSVPPDGFKKVTNIYYDPATTKLVVVYKS